MVPSHLSFTEGLLAQGSGGKEAKGSWISASIWLKIFGYIPPLVLKGIYHYWTYFLIFPGDKQVNGGQLLSGCVFCFVLFVNPGRAHCPAVCRDSSFKRSFQSQSSKVCANKTCEPETGIHKIPLKLISLGSLPMFSSVFLQGLLKVDSRFFSTGPCPVVFWTVAAAKENTMIGGKHGGLSRVDPRIWSNGLDPLFRPLDQGVVV